MRVIKQVKAHHVGDAAAAARDAGQQVFAARLKVPNYFTLDTSGPIQGWAEMIEAIEAQGWVLVQWTASVDKKDRPEAYPLFRRAVERPPAR